MDETSQQETEEVAQLLIAMQQQQLPEHGDQQQLHEQQEQWQQEQQQLWEQAQEQEMMLQAQGIQQQQQQQQFTQENLHENQQLQEQQFQAQQHQQEEQQEQPLQMQQQQLQQLLQQEQQLEVQPQQQLHVEQQLPESHEQQLQNSQEEELQELDQQQPPQLIEAPQQLQEEQQNAKTEPPEDGEVSVARTAQSVLQDFIDMLTRQQNIGEPMNVQQIQQYFRTCGVDPNEISRLLDQQTQEQREAEQQQVEQQQQFVVEEQPQQQQQQQQHVGDQQNVEQQQLQLQQFAYPQQQLVAGISDGDVSQQDQQETTTVYILYTQDENTAVQSQTISSSSLLEAAVSNCASTVQSSSVSATQSLIGRPQGEQIVMTRTNALPPSGLHGPSAISLAQGQQGVPGLKSLLRPLGVQQKAVVGGRVVQSAVTQHGIAMNVAQQRCIMMPRSQLVAQSVMGAKTSLQAGRQMNNNKVMTVGSAPQQIAQTAVQSPRQVVPPHSLRHMSPGRLTFIRTSTGQVVQVPTSSLQTLTGQRLAGVDVAKTSVTPNARAPASLQRFVTRAPAQLPTASVVTPPRSAVSTALIPTSQCNAAVNSAAPVSASALGGQVKIVADQGGSNLVVGQQYTLQYPNGRVLNVIWDGKYFKLAEGATVGTGSPAQPSNPHEGGQVRGGGGGNRKLQQKTMRGNRTGLNMVSSSGQQVIMTNATPMQVAGCIGQQASGLVNGGRRWNHSSVGKEKLTRPTLHGHMNSEEGNMSKALGVTAGTPHEGSGFTGESEAAGSVGAIKPQKRPSKPREPGKYAVCDHCGNMSEDYDTCDSCCKPLPDEPRFFTPQPSSKTPRLDRGAASAPLVLVTNISKKTSMLAKKQFYGNTAVTSKFIQGPHRRVNIKAKNLVQKLVTAVPKKGTKLPRKRVIETVTILSSDDEDNHAAASGGNVVATTTASIAAATGEVTSATNSPLVPAAATTTTTAQQYISRRQRMEDEHGNVVLPPGSETEIEKEQTKTAPPSLGSATSCVSLVSRNIRIGSLQCTPVEPVTVSTVGVHMCIRCCNEKLMLHISAADLTKIVGHFGTVIPLLFIYTTPEGAAKIRNSCRMGAPDGPLFDPASTDETQKRITVTLKSLSANEKDGLRHICHEIQLRYPSVSQGVLLNEISQEQANSILVISTPNVVKQVSTTVASQLVPQTLTQTLTLPQTASVVVSNGQIILQLPAGIRVGSAVLRLGNGHVGVREDGDEGEDEEEEAMDRSRSPSPQHHIFSGPIIKLFTFPPAPATGGITVTNEDLFCLNEGEFINDVIIDFYLKFIFLEHLSKEDQARTHIFSSFFYRRLTQKHRKNSMVDEDPNMTLPERRHARVKTWSRHVDLFDKDVIIVPINESAHWYLAIICFPGLRKPIHEEIIPPSLPKPTSPVLSSTSTSTTDILKTPSKISLMSVSSPSPSSTTVSSSTSSSVTPTKWPSGMALLQANYVEDDQNQSDSGPPTSSSEETTVPTSVPANDSDTAADNAMESAAAKDTAVTPNLKTAPTVAYSVKQPAILIFDSLSGPSRSSVVRTLREYLQVEWDVKKAESEGPRMFDKDGIRGANPKVPQQTNYSDCGIYILQYVESFFEKPIVDYSIPVKGLVDWFPDDRVQKKRAELRELILELQTRLNPDLTYDPTQDGCLSMGTQQ